MALQVCNPLFSVGELSLKYFLFCFLTGWALHYTTADIIYNVTWVIDSDTLAHKLGSPLNLFNGSRKFSG